jgi:hypothetical protein
VAGRRGLAAQNASTSYGYFGARMVGDFPVAGWPDLSAFVWVRRDAGPLAGVAVHLRHVYFSVSVSATGFFTTGPFVAATQACPSCESPSAALGDGAWHLVGAVRRAGVMQLYLDGVLMASCPCSGAFVQPTNPEQAPDPEPFLFIGSTWGSAGNVLLGSLDDVALWSRALSPAEIAALYGTGF